MNLLSQLGRNSPNRVFFATMLGIFSGIGYAMLVPIIIGALSEQPVGYQSVAGEVYSLMSIEVTKPGFAAIFFGICISVMLSRTASKILLVKSASEMTIQLRSRVAVKIAEAPVSLIESLGSANLTTILTEDVRRVVVGGEFLPDLLTNSLTLFATLGYLYYVNSGVFFFVVKAICVGVVTYQIPLYFGRRVFLEARMRYDELQEGIRALVFGVKELKLDALKRKYFFSRGLIPRGIALAAADNRARAIFAFALSYGSMINFGAVGIVAFVFVNYHQLNSVELMSIVVALLYVAGPVAVVMNMMAPIMMANVSLGNIERLLGSIEKESHPTSSNTNVEPWTCIELRKLRYTHASKQDGFCIGPIDLTIKKGEITFIVGGNGSGKSTLGKLLSLHYTPAEGAIIFGSTPICDGNIDSFRRGIGAVYTDYFLFDRLLRDSDEATLLQAEYLLERFALNNKIHIVDGKFSTTALSDGQRKRLALVIALLDDKQLYIFDEWAADQDPAFKEIFYRSILPQIRDLGKAIVVISHDDRYFDVADVCYVMADGMVVSRKSKKHGNEQSLVCGENA